MGDRQSLGRALSAEERAQGVFGEFQQGLYSELQAQHNNTVQSRHRDWAAKAAVALNRMRQGAGEDVQRAYNQFPNPYGATGFMDPCGDNDYLSLTLAGRDPFSDVIDYVPTNKEEHRYDFIEYVLPEEVVTGGQAALQIGHVDEQQPRRGTRGNARQFRVEGFGLVGRAGEYVSQYSNTLKRDQTPMTRIDGSLIDSNEEYQEMVAGLGVLYEWDIMRFQGDGTNGQTKGLEQIVAGGQLDATGAAFNAMNSRVINWAGDPLANTVARDMFDARNVAAAYGIPAGTSLLDVLEADVIAKLAAMDAAPRIRPSDLGPDDMFIACSFNHYFQLIIAAAYRYTADAANAAGNLLKYRDDLLGNGSFGYGYLPLFSRRLPFVVAGSGIGNDMYVLTRRAGNMQTLFVEHYDMNTVKPYSGRRELATDGGKFHIYWDTIESTQKPTVDCKLRWVCTAPYLQTRIQNVGLTGALGSFSFDPANNDYIHGPMA